MLFCRNFARNIVSPHAEKRNVWKFDYFEGSFSNIFESLKGFRVVDFFTLFYKISFSRLISLSHRSYFQLLFQFLSINNLIFQVFSKFSKLFATWFAQFIFRDQHRLLQRFINKPNALQTIISHLSIAIHFHHTIFLYSVLLNFPSWKKVFRNSHTPTKFTQNHFHCQPWRD